jgi:hypothetical protein
VTSEEQNVRARRIHLVTFTRVNRFLLYSLNTKKVEVSIVSQIIYGLAV